MIFYYLQNKNSCAASMISEFLKLQWTNDPRTSPNRDYWILRRFLDHNCLLAAGYPVLAHKRSFRDFLGHVLPVYARGGLVAGIWPHYRKMASDSGKHPDLHLGAQHPFIKIASYF